MHDGFIKVAAASLPVRVADPGFNAQAASAAIFEACAHGAKLIVLPELCLTGYTCSDLFYQKRLLDAALTGLLEVTATTAALDALICLGLPFAQGGKLYNVAAVLNRGRILGLVPKIWLPTYGEYYEQRQFTSGLDLETTALIAGVEVPFGAHLLFTCEGLEQLVVGVELCEDLWVASPPSVDHALAGATVIANCSASSETIAKSAYRRSLVALQSARLLGAYVYANAGVDESTTDLVFSGHNLIAENGVVLAESPRFTDSVLYADLDLDRLLHERRRTTTWQPAHLSSPHLSSQAKPRDLCSCKPENLSVPQSKEHFAPVEMPQYRRIPFALEFEQTTLERSFAPHPFVPSDGAERAERCEEILTIQAMGLRKRLAHTGLKQLVVGLSGGLDSTLALLVGVRALDLLHLPRTGMLAVTMPGFGTTSRTHNNAVALAEALGVTLREIPINQAVEQHFSDIGHDPAIHDVTYENAQARERTQILMDLANANGALVVGTGDMSELALGWATYNGDHMSMYAVNVGVPKTLVRHLVRFYADVLASATVRTVLCDVLDTPVSPELLPATAEGEISQRTEDLVGPYELHDFFLYYMLRWGYEPRKVHRIARLAFAGSYDDETILRWLKVFYQRFFAQQFKRSCLPDGPKVGSVALSPRGDLRMPSDASVAVWLEQLEDSTGQGVE
nr:NAD+ synthase [uncultured bacterium]